MSKTAEAWARIQEIQNSIGRMAIGIMVSRPTARELFGGCADDFTEFETHEVVTRMGRIEFYINDDLDPDELIVL